jgi:hypothetical protein
LRSARLLCDEDSGMIVRIEVEFEGHREVQRSATFEYLGLAAAGVAATDSYRRPW